jgi:hypothetical protein
MNNLTNQHKVFLQQKIDYLQKSVDLIGTDKHPMDIICGLGATIRSLDYNLTRIQKEVLNPAKQ